MAFVDVPLRVDAREWFRLSGIAEARGVKVADLLAEAAGVVIENGHRDELVTELRRARAHGFRMEPGRGRSLEEVVQRWRRRNTFGGEVWSELDPVDEVEKVA